MLMKHLEQCLGFNMIYVNLCLGSTENLFFNEEKPYV